MDLFLEDAADQLGVMARARFHAADARQAKDSKAFGAEFDVFALALQEFTSSIVLAKVVR